MGFKHNTERGGERHQTATEEEEEGEHTRGMKEGKH